VFGQTERAPATASKASGGEPLQDQPNRQRGHTSRRAISLANAGGIQPKNVAHLAYRDSLCWHRPCHGKSQRTDAKRVSGQALLIGRFHLGMSSDIESEWRAISSHDPGDFVRTSILRINSNPTHP